MTGKFSYTHPAGKFSLFLTICFFPTEGPFTGKIAVLFEADHQRIES